MIDIYNVDKYVENNRIEAKKALGGLPKSLWETYSAFSNTYGGIILLGVEEYKNKSLHPVDLAHRDKLIKEFWSIVNDKSKVSANVLTNRDVVKATVGGKRIIVIFVPRARAVDRPVYIGGDVYAGTFRRSGEGDYRCNKEQVANMIKEATGSVNGVKIAKESSLDSLDEKCLSKYSALLVKAKSSSLKVLSKQQLLVKVNALGYDIFGEIKPTLAGLIAFGKVEEIVKEFPNFSLVYRETRKDKTIYKITSKSRKKEYNAFNFYLSVMRRIKKFSKAKFADENKANSVVEAFKEAMTNALFNADYYGESGIEIVNNSSEIIFANAGSFRIDLRSVKNGGVSDAGNAVLARIFNFVGVGESVGGGIPKIFSLSKKCGFLAPSIKEQFVPEKIIFTLPLTKKEEKNIEKKAPTSIALLNIEKAVVIDYLTERIHATDVELKELLNASGGQIKQLLTSLIKENVIEIVADGLNNSYKLKR